VISSLREETLLVFVVVVALGSARDDWSGASAGSTEVHHWREGLRRSLFDRPALHEAQALLKLSLE